MDDLQRTIKIISKDKFSNEDVKWMIDNNFDFLWESVDLKKIKNKNNSILLHYFFIIKKMNKHVKSLIELFKKNDIPLILLKGAAENYLQKPNFVRTSDIDILVKRKDLKSVEKIMIKAGYQKESQMRDYYSKFHFHHVYYQPNKKSVEIHWGLIDKCFDFNFDEEIIWNKRIKKIEDNVFILEPEFEVIYLILSCFREFCRHFLKDSLRIKNLMKSDFDFKKFNYYVHFHKADDFVKHFFMLCNRNGIFDSPHYFKTRSWYRKLILNLFFGKMTLNNKGWNLKHFFFLFLLYPNPKYMYYYFSKGLSYFLKKDIFKGRFF